MFLRSPGSHEFSTDYASIVVAQLLGIRVGISVVHVLGGAAVVAVIMNALCESRKGEVDITHNVHGEAHEGQGDGEEQGVNKQLDEICSGG